MNAHLTDLDNILDNGEWVRHGLVWRWEADDKPATTKEPRDYRPSELIACPTCLAKMDERCKSKRGRPDHSRRLVKRVCSCGGPIRPQEPICAYCRADRVVAA